MNQQSECIGESQIAEMEGPNDRPVRFVRLSSPEELALVNFQKCYGGDPGTDEEIKTLDDVGEVGGESFDGDQVNMGNGRDFALHIHEMGVCGFAYEPTREIFYWHSEDIDAETLAFFMGHEVGHLVGEPIKDEVAEEARANTHGYAAREVFRFMKQHLEVQDGKSIASPIQST